MNKNVCVEGLEGIKATIIADSRSPDGKRITTFELEYPRFVHAELMTHRLFSRNAASSRAIPILKMIKMVWSNPATPVHWGVNQSGMQASGELSGSKLKLAKGLWRFSSKLACAASYALYKTGLHKQLANRITEPFQRYKIVMTTTELQNWFWLRNHQDAQPEIRELAGCMFDAIVNSVPENLNPGEWHVPYVEVSRTEDGARGYIAEGKVIDLPTALKISSSCCAQVSYRTLNQSVKTAESIYNKLVTSSPCHASPFEHQATPMVVNEYRDYWEDGNASEGVTHVDRYGNPWSGNFKGWIQHRQLIPENAKW